MLLLPRQLEPLATNAHPINVDMTYHPFVFKISMTKNKEVIHHDVYSKGGNGWRN
jgi:hypothetical protein